MLRRISWLLSLWVLPFHTAAQAPRLLLPVAASDVVELVRLSPGQQFLVASSYSPAEVKVWDTRTRQLLYTLRDQHINPYSVCFSADGTELLTSDETHFSLWRLKNGSLRLRFEDPGGGGMATFSHNGRYLLSSTDGTIRIREAATGQALPSIPTGRYSAYPLLLSPDDQLIATACVDTIYLRRFPDGAIVDQYAAAPPLKTAGYGGNKEANLLKDLAFCNRGQGLVSLYFDSSLCVRDLRQQSNRLALFTSGHFSLDETGEHMAVLQKNKLSTWDLVTGQLLYQEHLTEDYGMQISLSRDGRYLLRSEFTSEQQYQSRFFTLTGKAVDISLPNQAISSFAPFYLQQDSFLVFSAPVKGVLLQRLKDNRPFATPQLFSWQSQQLAFVAPEKKSQLLTLGDTLVQVLDLPTARVHSQYAVPGGLITGNTALAVKPSDDFEGKIPDTILLLDPLNGKLKQRLLVNGAKGKIFISNSGQYLLADEGMMSETMRLLNVHTGKLLKEIKKDGLNPVEEAWFLEKSGLIVTTNQINSLSTEIYDSRNGRLHLVARNYPDEEFDYSNTLHHITYSSNNRYLAICSYHQLSIWDLVTKQKLKTISSEKEGFAVAAFSPNDQWLAYGTQKGTIVLLQMNGFTSGLTIRYHQSYIHHLAFSPDGQQLFASETLGPSSLHRCTNGELICELPTSAGFTVVQTDFSNHRAALSDGAVLEYFDLVKGEKLLTIACAGPREFIFLRPDGYYLASPEITRKIGWSIHEQICSFNQLDVHYNRPDKVLHLMSSLFGTGDSTLPALYRKAWEKRMKKLGLPLTEQRPSVIPESRIRNRDEIPYEMADSLLTLKITGLDSSYALRRLNIWVNEVPLYGSRGIPLSVAPGRLFDTTLILRLSEGENSIEASVTNAAGTESYRIPLPVRYTARQPVQPRIWFIGIGIDRFADPNYNLAYCSKDIRDLARRFRLLYGNALHIDTLINETVTPERVTALKQRLLNTGIEDKVIVAYSGHGLLSRDYDYYLSAYNVNFSRPESGGLPYSDFENLMDSIPARKKLMLIDACHSGEVDKEEMSRIRGAADTLSRLGTRGVKPTNTGTATVGMQNSFELMQTLFVNVGRSTGATVIAAAAGTQFAQEKGSLQNGVFTYTLLEALQLFPHLQVGALKNYISQRVVQLTNGLQQPTSRSEALALDWDLW